ncbi:LacI family DNA-binding transcriptional regulator [Pseudolysinimonas kribbensis]|uniref:LacI family transcriptional regulator n=1 Tax=Pseudolysinimonas kribbensis TaxID=433641 RepID=A0ABQ6KBC0_9MICO|nr:LacI family DNA-binding transcriptional regulator [Pseudolysinimonas kribbensis]GMA95987.1 LacI family transcriptional regulator [Pseudolysinimonas kribbensis]
MVESRRAPNMYDVATRAGVSHQTVSRVLNGSHGVLPATRDRVLGAIAELGYRRNLAARTLATSRTRAIGVLTPATADFGPTSSLHAIERAVREAGYQSLITSTPVDAEAVRASLEFLLGRSVEALVVIAPYRVVLDALAEVADPPPVVALQTGDPADGVTVDQVAGARLAARHLVELGHRWVQQLVGPDDFVEAGVRRDAAAEVLAAAGLEPLPDLRGDWTADSGYAAAAALDPRATAVLCGNDQMALGLVHALADRGRRVPEEVSVVGFDDIPESAHSLPPLTTVHQDFVEVGRRAVARLLALLEGEVAPSVGSTRSDATEAATSRKDSRVEPWLVVRGSTAPRGAEETM